MSAFMVPVEHIRAMINAGLEGRYGPLSWQSRAMTDEERERAYEPGQPWGPEAPTVAALIVRQLTLQTAERVGAMLLAENRRSVDFRYAEEELEEVYTHGPSGRRSVVEIFKAIACYEYQSCETPDWEQSEAFAFCAALRYELGTRLPGYDDAEWVIDTP